MFGFHKFGGMNMNMLLGQPNDGEAQRGSGWKWKADVYDAGRETRLRSDSSAT